MAENQLISQEEVRGIDINQVDSLQLKDGTVIVVTKEEQPIEETTLSNEQNFENYVDSYAEEDQANSLRARPMIGRMFPPRIPLVAPLRPLPPKPIVVPRGPMRPIIPVAYGPVLRGKGVVPVPQPRIPIVNQPHYAPPLNVKQVMGRPGELPPGLMPSINKMGYRAPLSPGPLAFRSRPAMTEEYDFQEEQYNGEDEGNEQYNNQLEEEYPENQLRARPLVGVPIVPPPRHYHPPRIVPLPVAPIHPKRGPAVRIPMVGYNTFQPRLFRARQRTVVGEPKPMFIPLNATFQPRVRPMSHHPGKRIPLQMKQPNLLRARPRSNSYDEKEYDEQMYENQCQLNTEGNKYEGPSVCTRCGKEF